MNTFYVSPASFWEIAIKLSKGVSLFTEPYLDFIEHSVFDNGFQVLSIDPYHCDPLISLPFHHKDPFDRIIIAQAIVEKMPIIGSDTKFDLYPVQRIW